MSSGFSKNNKNLKFLETNLCNSKHPYKPSPGSLKCWALFSSVFIWTSWHGKLYRNPKVPSSLTKIYENFPNYTSLELELYKVFYCSKVYCNKKNKKPMSWNIWKLTQPWKCTQLFKAIWIHVSSVNEHTNFPEYINSP